LQSIILRKILEAFRTFLIAILKIKAKLLLIALRLQQKCNKYTIRLATLTKNYLIRMRISSSFTLRYNIETKINKKRYLN